MLKNQKPKKQEKIKCPNCKRKIDISTEEEQENIVRIGNTRVYECNCGEQILL